MENKKPIIIFGGAGQDGYYLKKLLETQGQLVYSYGFSNKKFKRVDVGDYIAVSNLIKLLRPTMVFHLAAKSTTKHDAILLNQNAIVNGTVSILEAVEKFVPKCKVFIASSGLIFENKGKPINEKTKLVSDTAYALARVQSLMCARYYRRRGLMIYVGILFNHESSLRPKHSIAKQIVRDVLKVSRGKINKIKIGNADTVKEWTYAEDSVRAMLTLTAQSDIFEANIGSGVGYSIKTFAEICCNSVGKKLQDYLIENKEFTPQYMSFTSDPSLIKSIGWNTTVDIFELANKMLQAEVSNY